MIVFPPNNATGYVTDEDSGDEDGWGKLIICLQVCSWHKQNLKSVDDDSDDETKDNGFNQQKKRKKICFMQKAEVKHEK